MSRYPNAPATVAVIGEVLVDLATSGGADFVALPGGAPANVAVALSRLGVPTELLARISEDSFGELARDYLEANSVGCGYCVTAREPTTLAIATITADKAATYSFYTQGTANWQWTADELPDRLPKHVRALVTGSLALALPPGAEVLEAFVAHEHRRGEVFIAYDPNIRPSMAATRTVEAARVERQLALAHLVKASEDDLLWLYPDRDPIEVAHRWQQACGGWVVVTRGAQGAYSVCPSGEAVAVAGHTVLVRDTIGADDAFLAGLLAALADQRLFSAAPGAVLQLLTEDVVTQAMSYASTVSAIACTRAGANPPTRDEVREAVREEQPVACRVDSS